MFNAPSPVSGAPHEAPRFSPEAVQYNLPAAISRRFIVASSLGLLLVTLLGIVALPGRDTSRYLSEGRPQTVVVAAFE